MHTPTHTHTSAQLARTDTRVHRPAPLTVHPPAPAPAVERRIVGYEHYAGGLVPVYEQHAPTLPTPPRDLTPQPLFDPRAQRYLAAGVGTGAAAAGIGWGIGQALTGLTTGAGIWILAALIALATNRSGATHITQHNTATGLFSRAGGTINRP
ncbi:hypothetical protein GCM10012287_46570 [Streptomyces daqingensis]|uniref:Uncharacterized protein n=1 Tax=Streptomyces daqingensis TaxID=1472640 RepID=A0ABQ2MP39_9ACTN|nr:hypothetical protein [Streptomyces daqingensis]GGO55396.1 hypothetical protein GCM10012287_46570 [Streptomyces daqingensis]